MEEFQQTSSQGFMHHNGGLQFRTVSASEYRFRTTIEDNHLNPGGTTHGGYIMTVLDSGMGNGAYRCLGSQTRIATISLDVKFIASSKTGDLLEGTARVLKKTRSLVFMQGELRCGKRLIATAEGVWKTLT